MEQKRVSKEISVIIVHPCEIIRHAIATLLQQVGYQVPLLTDSCEPLLKQSGGLKVDLVLAHYSQCKSSGFIRQVIDQTGANVALLASSDSYHKDGYQDMTEQIAEGIIGFLDMDEPLNAFLSEIEDIAFGDIVISRNFVKNLSKHTPEIEEKLEKLLSNRETEILNLVGEGKTNKEIGEELFISEHTVKVHLGNILTKLNLKNRQQAALYILRKHMMAEQHSG